MKSTLEYINVKYFNTIQVSNKYCKKLSRVDFGLNGPVKSRAKVHSATTIVKEIINFDIDGLLQSKVKLHDGRMFIEQYKYSEDYCLLEIEYFNGKIGDEELHCNRRAIESKLEGVLFGEYNCDSFREVSSKEGERLFFKHEISKQGEFVTELEFENYLPIKKTVHCNNSCEQFHHDKDWILRSKFLPIFSGLKDDEYIAVKNVFDSDGTLRKKVAVSFSLSDPYSFTLNFCSVSDYLKGGEVIVDDLADYDEEIIGKLSYAFENRNFNCETQLDEYNNVIYIPNIDFKELDISFLIEYHH